jgi:hypothetical protein
MAKKNTKKQESGFIERPADDEPVGRKKRIALKVDDGGDVLWDQVEPEEKASVIAALLGDSDAQQAFSAIAAEQPEAAISGGWNNDDAAFILNAFSLLNCWAFQRMKVDKDIAAACTAFTPEQHATLDPRGAKLLNKWLPGDFLYKDEIMFLGALSQIVMLQLQTAMAAMRERHGAIVEGTEAQPVNGHAKEVA